MGAHGAAAVPRRVDNWQARRTVPVEFLTRSFNWLGRAAARRCGAHDVFDAHLGRAPVVGSDIATDVTLGDNADQLEVFGIRHNRRAAATRSAHRPRGVCRRILRGTARRRFDWFHHIAATTHVVVFQCLEVFSSHPMGANQCAPPYRCAQVSVEDVPNSTDARGTARHRMTGRDELTRLTSTRAPTA